MKTKDLRDEIESCRCLKKAVELAQEPQVKRALSFASDKALGKLLVEKVLGRVNHVRELERCDDLIQAMHNIFKGCIVRNTPVYEVEKIFNEVKAAKERLDVIFETEE